MTMKFDLKK